MDLNKLSYMFATVIFNVCIFMYIYISINLRSRERAIGIATVYELDDRGFGVWVPVGERIFTSPRRPDRLWGPLSLLSNRYCGVKLTTLLQLVPSSRLRGSIHPLSHRPSWRSAKLVKHRDFTSTYEKSVKLNLHFMCSIMSLECPR
jgi:hypothetical protein